MTDFETRSADWLTYREALDTILGSGQALERETVPLLQALGRALAEPLEAPTTLPPWDNSAMDGYAVLADDIATADESNPVRLRVIGRIMAGQPADLRVEPGTAVRIMTGAPVPDGADTVVRVEHTDREAEEGWVLVSDAGDAHRNIRPAGRDWSAGASVLEAGRSVTPGLCAVIASLGRSEVPVHGTPVCAVLTTGDELLDISETGWTGRHGIPESNSHLLAAQITEAGSRPLLLGNAADDDEALRSSLRGAAGADVLVTVGGASMGEGDRVKRVLDGLGYRQSFWRVRIRPGSPFSFGFLEMDGKDIPVFGLPGNPASAFVTFELFVRPFLRRLAGHSRTGRRILRVTAGEALNSAEHLDQFVRVSLSGDGDGLRARLAGHQSSGLVTSVGQADGLAVIPIGTRTVDVGEPVDVILLSSDA